MKTKILSTENAVYVTIAFLLWVIPPLSEAVQSFGRGIEYDWYPVVEAWKRYFPFLLVFILHNTLLAPLAVYRHKHVQYAIGVLVLVGLFAAYECTHRPHHPRPGEAGGPPRIESREGESSDEFMEDEDDLALYEEEATDDRMKDGGCSDKSRKSHEPQPLEPGDQGFEDHRPPLLFGQHDIVAVIILLLLLSMNLGVKIFFLHREEQERMMEIEKVRLRQQLNYLRYQISPHFLMNTLNNIHALVDIDPTAAQKAIVELSRLMRYTLYDGDKQMVPLAREVDFLQHYIALMRIRFTEQVDISFEAPNPLPSVNVPPLLYATFMENAFKHGVSYQQESFVHITFSHNDKYLSFHCQNSLYPRKTPATVGGVGLKNVRERLELLYTNNYNLDIQEGATTYDVHLDIPLNYSPTTA